MEKSRPLHNSCTTCAHKYKPWTHQRPTGLSLKIIHGIFTYTNWYLCNSWKGMNGTTRVPSPFAIMRVDKAHLLRSRVSKLPWFCTSCDEL